MSKVFVDTSMFKALVDERDEFHKSAVSIWKKLEQEKVTLVTSNYILDEAFTLIRAKCGVIITDEFRRNLLSSTIVLKIIRVTVADESNAWKWFLNDWSNLSFTDCVSFALMERLGLEHVATFDQHFSRAGFKVR